MKHDDLPLQMHFNLMADIKRFSVEYQWENKVSAKIIRRLYGIDLSIKELEKLQKQLGIDLSDLSS